MMINRMHFTTVAVLLAALLALIAAPAVMAEVGDPVSALPRTGRASASSAASLRLAVPDAAVAALPVTSSRVFRTYTVTGLHTQPDTSSAVISWIMPNSPVRILGLSRDLAFYAMATNENSPIVAGWIAMRDVAFEPPMEPALRVAMVYGQPDTSGDVIDYVVPGQAVSLLGVSPDGKWAAVRIGGVTGTAGWLQSVHLRQTLR
jgi:hypothetical protein